MTTNNGKNQPTAASGKVLQGQGVGTASNFSTATYPSLGTGTGKILRADGTNWVPTTATFPDLSGALNNVLTSNGTNWISSPLSSGLMLSSGTITNAEIKALRGTPKVVIAAPGSGKIAVPLHITMTMNYGGSEPFTAADDVYIQLQYPGPFIIGSTGAAPLVQPAIVPSNSTFCYSRCVTVAETNKNVFTNVTVSLANTGSSEITGNASNNNTMSWELLYYIMTF